MGKKLFYPKIETLFDRDPKTHKVIEGKYRLKEFANIKEWFVTEKIHGINVSACYRPTKEYVGQVGAQETNEFTGHEVVYNGRSPEANIPQRVLDCMTTMFTKEKFEKAFSGIEPSTYIRIFGEAYGPRVEKGGGNYRSDVSVRVFDVWVSGSSKDNPFLGWWLDPKNVRNVAMKFDANVVPALGTYHTIDQIVDVVKKKATSRVSYVEGKKGHIAEGVVARTWPELRTRKGKRLMWKLKVKDFA